MVKIVSKVGIEKNWQSQNNATIVGIEIWTNNNILWEKDKDNTK